MTLVLVPSVVCKNCSSPPCPIFLPYPNPPGTDEGQPAWPRDNWRAKIACHECGNVYEYLAQDVHWGGIGEQIQIRFLDRPTFFAFEIGCEEPNCESRTRIHFYIDSAQTENDVLETIWSANLHELTCSFQHPLKLTTDSPLVLERQEKPIG